MNPGVLYFVFGKKGRMNYFDLLERSVKSLRHHMPNLKIGLHTNIKTEVDKLCDDVFYTEHPGKRMWQYKWNQCLPKSPYNPTLHLDADTYICDDFSEVFDLMKTFDLAIPISPFYAANEPLEGVPECFPELAGGFILWQDNERVRNFFERTFQLVRRKHWRRADEPSLRKALFESDVRFAIVPWEYTCVYNYPGYVYGKVKILHGWRNSRHLRRLEEKFNRHLGGRVYTGEKIYHLTFSKKTRLTTEHEVIQYRN